MYFEMLTRELDDVSHLFVVLKDHHVADAVICTSCGGIVQDHLGGTRDAFLKFSPTRLAVDTVRVWAKENGARVFHLAGASARGGIRYLSTKPAFLIADTRFSRGAGSCSRTFMKSSARRKSVGTRRAFCSRSRPDISRRIAIRRRRPSSAKEILQQPGLHFLGASAARSLARHPDSFPVPVRRACTGTPHRAEGPLSIGTCFDPPYHRFGSRGSTVLPRTMMRILTTNQREEWTRAVQRATQHDFYFLPEYHALAERRGGRRSTPFHLRAGRPHDRTAAAHSDVARSPGINRWATTWRDATSVYGYSDPLYSHEEMPQGLDRRLPGRFGRDLQELRLVSVFSRLHPLLPVQTVLLDGLGDHQVDGVTVSINLLVTPPEQRAQYHAMVRNRVNRLARSDVTCVLDVEQRHLPEFITRYFETIRRVKAEQSYFFDPTYFSDLAKSLGRVLKLFVVRMPDGEVISAGLFTLCEGIVQYHLGGTRDTALKLSPMVLLFETVRRWSHENGAHTFHLGGKTDSLFQFKAQFSWRRDEFVTWRWIVAPETYRELSRQQQLSDSERGLRAISPSLFPAYRCPSEPDTVPAALRAPAPAMAAPDEIQVAQNG